MRVRLTIAGLSALCLFALLLGAPWSQTNPFYNFIFNTVTATMPLAATDYIPVTQSSVVKRVPGTSMMAADGSNATLPAARYQIAANYSCNPVSDFGADPTGIVDASAAINSCAAVVKDGHDVNIYLPTGTFKLTNKVSINNGQCIYGDGRGLTTIAVTSDFNTTDPGVIVMTGGLVDLFAPCVHDLDISFVEPTVTATRSSYTTLALGCTVTASGTGCKYPPAIYSSSSARMLLKNLRVIGAWDGITLTGNSGGFFIENVEMGALNVGLTFDGGQDFCHIKSWHSWPFGLSGGGTWTIYQDGGTYAAKMGRCDGLKVVDFASFEGRLSLTSAFSFGQFSNLALDGNNATLEIAGNQWLQIDNVYTTGTASGANANCQVNIAAGYVSLTNVNIASAGSGDPGTGLCVTGGVATVTGGIMVSSSTTARAIKQTSGILSVNGIFYQAAGTYTVPLVDAQGGTITFTGNSFAANSTNVGGVVIAVDAAANTVAGNNFNGWTFTAPGALGAYWLNGPASNFSTNGTITTTNATASALTNTTTGAVLVTGGMGVSGRVSTGGVNIVGHFGDLILYDGAGASDQNYWDILNSGASLSIRALNDAFGAANTAWTINRGSGYTISDFTVTPKIIPTGGVAASGGFTVSPRTWGTCGVTSVASTTAFTDQTPVITEVYASEVFVPANTTVTGLAIRSGSVASGNVKVGLADVAGNVLKTSGSTAVAGAAGVYQRVPFTSSYAITGPATYYALTFFDNTTVRASAHTQGNCGAGKLTAQTYATGFVSNASLAPTTFTTALGPVASLY